VSHPQLPDVHQEQNVACTLKTIDVSIKDDLIGYEAISQHCEAVEKDVGGIVKLTRVW
jgi:hypothetical protein